MHGRNLPALRAEAQLSIQLIGGIEIAINGRKVQIPKEKARALIVVLAMAMPRRVSRERLRGLLWSDSDEAAAQTSLRNAIWVLKRILEAEGFRGLNADRQSLWIEPETTTTDVDHLVTGLRAGQPDRERLADVRSAAGFFPELGGTTLMLDWLAEARRELCDRLVAAAETGLKTQATVEDRITILSFLVTLNPLDEARHRALMRLFAESGQIANALTCYQSLWNLLDEEFGEEPSAETQELIVALKTAQPRPAAAASENPRPVIRLRAVDVSHLPAPRRVTYAVLRDSLLARLVRFREWRIVDEAQAGGTPLHDERFSLSLTAHEGEGRLICSILLAHSATGEMIWSETYADPTVASAPLAPDTVRNIAAALNLHISGDLRQAEAAQLISTHTQYERWVGARALMGQLTPASWQAAEDQLDRLIEENPRFVRALASRASIETMRQISFPGTYSSPDLHRRALELSSRAIEIDPFDSRAQLAMGWSCAMSRQFDRAELAYELAFQHNDNDPWTIASVAVGLGFCAKTGAALDLVRFLLALGLPLGPLHWSYIAATYFLTGDYDACAAASDRAAEASFDVPAWHAAALAQAGRKDAARERAARFIDIARANWAIGAPGPDSEITRWILACFPIRQRQVWQAFADGLIDAGLPRPSVLAAPG